MTRISIAPATTLVLTLFAIFLALSTALAEENVADTKDRLFARLAEAENEMTGRAVEFEIWEYWTAQAPDREVAAKLTRGMQKRREFDLPWAEDLFDEVIKAAPDYHEGWNQRAFVRFLRGNLEGALNDLEKTIALEPRHFGALSGMYNVLIQQGRPVPALRFLQRAVTIHPWLKERGALPRDMWPERLHQLNQPKTEL